MKDKGGLRNNPVCPLVDVKKGGETSREERCGAIFVLTFQVLEGIVSFSAVPSVWCKWTATSAMGGL